MRFNKLETMISGRFKRKRGSDSQAYARVHSTGRNISSKPTAVRVEELEFQLSEIHKRYKKVKNELKGYHSFKMPFDLPENALIDKVIDGKVKKWHNVLRHALL